MRYPRLLPPLLLFATASALSAGTYSAYTAQTSNQSNEVRSGSVALSDNDSGAAMLGLVNAGAGASDVSCIKVRSDGTLPSSVRMRAASTGALAPYLRAKIERGTGAAGFDNCSGFTAGPRDYYGLGKGVVSDGRLSDLPSTWTTAVSDPADDQIAASIIPLGAAHSGLVGLWEMGERTRAADNFDGAAGSTLGSRSELFYGTPWSRQSASGTNAVITATGTLRAQDPGLALYRVETASTAETVSADITVRSASGEAGFMTRVSASGNQSGYLVQYRFDGIWQLARIAADGTSTPLGSYTSLVSPGDTANVKLIQNGGSMRVLINGVERITATDATIGATGYSGIRVVGGTAPSDESGIQLDNFRTYQPDVAPVLASQGSGATAIGAPTTVAGAQPSPTDIQSAANFNGTTDALSLPASGLTTTATLAGWFRINSGNVTMRDSTTGTTAGWSLGYTDGAGTGNMKFRVSGQVFDTGIPFDQLRKAWHHHALTRSGSTVRYYLDGRLVFTGTASTTDAPVSPFIVMRDGSAAPFSAGRVDQVGIWSRALGADEIAAIRDGISAPAEWRSGTERWYRITVEVSEDPAATSLTGTGQFTWEAHSR